MKNHFQRTKEQDVRIARLRRKWLIRSGVALLGLAAGFLCPKLPKEKQAICHKAAEVIALVVGGTP